MAEEDETLLSMTDGADRNQPKRNAAAVTANALHALLADSELRNTDESVLELLLRRLLTLAPDLGSELFGVDADETLLFEKGRNTQQADIVGYARRAARVPTRPSASEWVARVQIEVKVKAAYNWRKEEGRYVGPTQLDRYADYADANCNGEPRTLCWVVLPGSRAGQGPKFREAYDDMTAQGVRKPRRWRVVTWEQVNLWVRREFPAEVLVSDEHTKLIRYLALGLDGHEV